MRYVLITALIVFAGFKAYAIATDTLTGTNAPAKVTGDVQELVNYLCDAMAADTVKANIIFNWITHNIAYDVKAGKDPDRPDPTAQQVLKDKKTTAEGYTLLFSEMCKAAGLQVVRVRGYAKDWKFDNGDKFYLPNHEWCAVLIDRRWEIVDPMQGAGGITHAPGWFRMQLNRFTKEKIQYYKKQVFEFKYDPEQFLPDPVAYRESHLPADPLWQLCKTHMPLNVFEAGDSAVAYYNEENPGRINRSAELEYIARLNEEQLVIECADRVSKFNTRYKLVLARKEQLEAFEQLRKQQNNTIARRSLEDAAKDLELADGYIKKQKDYIPDQYNTLKKKNSTKNRLALDYTRKIRTYNKALVSKCKMYARGAERKQSALEDKLDKAVYIAEHITPLRLDSIKTTAIQKDKSSPEMMAVMDSIEAKKLRIEQYAVQLEKAGADIKQLAATRAVALTKIAEQKSFADTVIVYQAEARVHFLDNYDDVVKLYMALLDDVRFSVMDTMLQSWHTTFDTLTARYEALVKSYQYQGDMYKALLREMEQYRRKNNTEELIVTAFGNACGDYTNCMNSYIAVIQEYNTFLEQNSKTYTEWATHYEGEEDVLERMEEGEAARKEAEDTDLNESKAYDERQMEKNKKNIAKLQEQVKEALSK